MTEPLLILPFTHNFTSKFSDGVNAPNQIVWNGVWRRRGSFIIIIPSPTPSSLFSSSLHHSFFFTFKSLTDPSVGVFFLISCFFIQTWSSRKPALTARSSLLRSNELGVIRGGDRGNGRSCSVRSSRSIAATAMASFSRWQHWLHLLLESRFQHHPIWETSSSCSSTTCQ